MWDLCTQVCYLRVSQASNLKGNGVSQSLGAKTQAACWQILLIQRRWNEKERKRGRWEGEGEEKQMEETGRVEQMGEKESERESAHTPLALSVDRLILTWLEWVCCGVLIDEKHAGLRPVLGGGITCVNWAWRHSNCWCKDTLLSNKNRPRIYLWGMPHQQLYFHAVYCLSEMYLQLDISVCQLDCLWVPCACARVDGWPHC